MVLICISPVINDVKRFSCLFCHLSIFFGEVPGQIFYLSIGLFSCQESSSYILNTGPLSSIKFTSIFCLWLFIQFLAVCFTGDLSSSLAACWSLPAVSSLLCGPLHRQLTTQQIAAQRQMSQRDWKTSVFHNTIFKVTSYCFCCILFFQSKLSGPAYA